MVFFPIIHFLHDLGVLLGKDNWVELEVQTLTILLCERVVELNQVRHQSTSCFEYFWPDSTLGETGVQNNVLQLELLPFFSIDLLIFWTLFYFFVFAWIPQLVDVLIHENDVLLQRECLCLWPADAVACLDDFLQFGGWALLPQTKEHTVIDLFRPR